MAVFLIPYILLTVFFTKTVLGVETITHTNLFFLKKQFLYVEIDTFEKVRNGHVKLNLIDGSSIQIQCGTNKQPEVLSIIRSKVLFLIDTDSIS